MKFDFSLKTLEELYLSLLISNYRIINLSDSRLFDDNCKICILRHDVDRDLNKALVIAELESKLAIQSGYFFRYKKTFIPEVVKKIYHFGHEIGYHYETLVKTGGNYPAAIELFKQELAEFRKIVPLKTISAHGSPLSRWDNRKLWNRYNFEDFGIADDASILTNFNQLLYLTDTGRAWNKNKGNIRDKMATKFNYKFANSYELIQAIIKGGLPDRIMLSIHPCRWSNNWFAWFGEFIGQNIKNLAKNMIIIR